MPTDVAGSRTLLEDASALLNSGIITLGIDGALVALSLGWLDAFFLGAFVWIGGRRTRTGLVGEDFRPATEAPWGFVDPVAPGALRAEGEVLWLFFPGLFWFPIDVFAALRPGGDVLRGFVGTVPA